MLKMMYMSELKQDPWGDTVMWNHSYNIKGCCTPHIENLFISLNAERF